MVWKAEPIWKGETGFIVAGGPSVREHNLELLRGRKIIAINSSIHILPWADVSFFGDMRWWKLSENRKAVQSFKGLVVTTAKDVRGNNIKIMQKTKPPGPSLDPRYVMMRRTSLSAAINLGMHFGCSRLVLLGADGQKAKDGRCHHHKPHPWPIRSGCWDEQKKDLLSMVEPLRKVGVEVLNASPGSAWNMWPVVKLEDVLSGAEAAPRSLAIDDLSPRSFLQQAHAHHLSQRHPDDYG